jgi:hypothetical protein
MKQAKYCFFPWRKLSIFNKGKKRLNALIEQHPSNVNLRYIRLVVQENTPSILNYKNKIGEDKNFLKEFFKRKLI